MHQLLLEKHRIVTRMIPENGVNCNRISTHMSNTSAEVQRLVQVIKSVA